MAAQVVQEAAGGGTASVPQRKASAAVRAAVPVRPGMPAVASIIGLPVSSTTRVPGGMCGRNAAGSAVSPGSAVTSSSSHHSAGASPSYAISRSRLPVSASTIASSG